MLQTTVLPIEHDDKHKQEAEQLKELLERNQMLFQMFLTGQKKISFLDMNEEDTIYIESIEDLKKLLSNIIPTYMEILHKQVYSNGNNMDTDLLRMLLVDIISSKEESGIDKTISKDINLNINTIYTVVAISYYNDEELIDFIFNPTGLEQEKIFKLLNAKERYNLMNMLLEEEYQKVLKIAKEYVEDVS